MLREAQLVFQHYIPNDEDYSNLMFLSLRRDGTPFIYNLTNLNKAGAEGHIEINGYPVKPWIIDQGDPNVPSEEILATPKQIGWFDEGEHSDELMDIELKHINTILDEHHGWVFIETHEDGEPTLFMDKVTISYFEDMDDEDEEDWGDDDITEWEDNNWND